MWYVNLVIHLYVSLKVIFDFIAGLLEGNEWYQEGLLLLSESKHLTIVDCLCPSHYNWHSKKGHFLSEFQKTVNFGKP